MFMTRPAPKAPVNWQEPFDLRLLKNTPGLNEILKADRSGLDKNTRSPVLLLKSLGFPFQESLWSRSKENQCSPLRSCTLRRKFCGAYIDTATVPY